MSSSASRPSKMSSIRGVSPVSGPPSAVMQATFGNRLRTPLPADRRRCAVLPAPGAFSHPISSQTHRLAVRTEGYGGRMRVGLVLGAGGVVGASWLIGALDALEAETGWRAVDAERIVGT